MPLWLRLQRINLVIGGATVAALVTTLFVIYLSPAFQDCVLADLRATPGEDFVTAITQFINIRTSCGGVFLGDHAFAMTAFASAVLAGAMIGLWLLTSQIGGIGSVGSAPSHSGHEPSLGVKKIQLIKLPPEKDSPNETYEVEFVLRNYGRNPVSVTRVATGNTVAAGPHHEPLFRFFYEPAEQTEMKRGEERVIRIPDQRLVITPVQRSQIDLGVVYPWVWGEVRYNDPAHGAMEWGFVAFQEKGMHIGTVTLSPATWRMRGPQAYMYSRYAAHHARI